MTEMPTTGSTPGGALHPSDVLDMVRAVLHEVAPEADVEQLGGDESLQEVLELDSIDFLNFAEGLHDRTGLEIPERDFPQLSTLNGAAGYLTSALAHRGTRRAGSVPPATA